TLATTGDGGGRALSSTSVACVATSAYLSFSNSGSRRASARAGPEPSAKNLSAPSSCESRQPAYWLARHAITGLDERLTSVHGQFGVTAESSSSMLPSPPMQISATRRPAAI